MNNLSLLLYLADALDSLKVISIIFLFLVIFGLIGTLIDGSPRARDLQKYCVIAAIVFSSLIVVCPTSSTVYAIAASEMGEEVITSPTAGKAAKALDAWLDKQISDLKEPKE